MKPTFRAMWHGPLALIAICISSCGGQADRAPAGSTELPLEGGPQLVLVDSVPLEETDARFVGRVSGLAVAPDGSVLVSDAMQGRVTRFARDGRFVQMYGRSGRGPGEFGAPTAIAFAGDTLMGIEDGRENRVSLLQYPSGEFIRSVQINELLSGELALGNDSIWVGARSVEAGTGMLVVDPVSGGSRRFLEYPSSIAESRVLSVRYGNATFHMKSRDSIFAIFRGASSTLYLIDKQLAVSSAWTIPERQRWGVPADLGPRMDAATSQQEEFRLTSSPFGVQQLDDGRIAVIHYDQTLRLDPIQLTNVGWLTVIDLVNEVACVDGSIPLSPDNFAAVRFAGDTLFTAEQAVLAGGRATTFVRVYTIQLDGCEWMPVRRLP